MQFPDNFSELIATANQFKLYTNLVNQLNKDLLYANVDVDFHEEILPTSLKLILQEEVYNLIQNNFSSYLNLLYIVDVSEDKIKSLDMEDTMQLAEAVTFLILKREWQKVWYRHKY
jgi:hypothetical protein